MEMIGLGLFRAGIALAERLPAGWLYAVARLAGLLLAAVPSAPRRRLRCNLAHALGGGSEARALARHVRRAHQTQAANYADLWRARTITPDEVRRRVRPEGAGWGVFERAVAERRGAVLVTAHFGRVELVDQFVGQWLAERGVGLTLPVERLRPPALFELVCRQRTRPTFTLVPYDVGLRPCLRALRRGEVVAFLADWDPSGQGVVVEFFGRPARLPAGPAHLALHTGAPLFVGVALPAAPDPPGEAAAAGRGTAGGRIVAWMEPPLEVERSADFDADVRRAVQLIARRFERHIARYPGQWVMFHDIWPCDAGCGLIVSRSRPAA